MSWEVSLEDDIKAAGLAGVAFNVTDSINMLFYPTLPLSTTEVKAEVEYAGETPMELTLGADGSYIFDGVLYERLATPFTFRLSGKAGEAADFVYEKEITPSQVAFDMIEAYAADEALVTMLKDMLLLGASFNVFLGEENWLADTGIVARDFATYQMGGVYSQLIYGEKTGDAEFTSHELVIAEDLYTFVGFKATDITNLQIRAVSNNTGDVVYYDADDFISLSGEGEYGLRLPVNAYDFSKVQLFSFVENGVELTDYYMLVSANNTIAALLDTDEAQQTPEICQLVVALYQFGESVFNYAESVLK
jgi:hypothetical protein